MMNYEEDKQLQHPITQRYKGVLKKLSDNRVAALLFDEPNKFTLLECCDEWFGYTLTKDDCLELSKLFRDIAEEINN